MSGQTSFLTHAAEYIFQGVFPQRDITVPHRVVFIKFAGAVVYWLLPQGWAVWVSLFQIFLYTSDWTSFQIIWPLTHYGLRIIFVVTKAARMIFCCSLSRGNILQAVRCFSENNIFLYHISLVFSASPAKVEHQIEPSSLKKTSGSVVS